VFAAASLGDYLQKFFSAGKQTPDPQGCRFLRRQFCTGAANPAGAPADCIYCRQARVVWTHWNTAGELRPGSRRDLLGNRPGADARQRSQAGHAGAGIDLVSLLQGERLGMAMVDRGACGAFTARQR